MPHRKQNKKHRKKKRNLSMTEQPLKQKTEEKLEHPRPHFVPIDISCVTGVSSDTVSSVPLIESKTPLSYHSLLKSQVDCLVAHDEICLDQNLFSRNEKANKYNQQPVTDVEGNINTGTEADKTLLYTIESADLDLAIIFLKGDHTFSQNGLDRALISSCRLGLRILVHTLVRLGGNVQFSDTHGNTPLLICAGNGFVDIVHFLLKMKADVNAPNSAGDTALILSIKTSGSLEMVKVLLEQKGIDINHQNRNGYTALMRAMEVRDVDVMKLLMDRTMRLSEDGIYRGVFRHRFCKLTQTFSNKEMREKDVADKCGLGNIYQIFQTHQRTRATPLLIAADTQDIESLNMLLDCHFVERRDVQEAFIKIFEKCDIRKVKDICNIETAVIKRLLECGAEMDTGWYHGSSPLSIAVQTGDYSLVELLCQHLDQQQLKHQNTTGALKAAAKSDRCDLIELLLKYHADNINGYNYSDSPLNKALMCGHFESAKVLIKHGAKMDIRSALQSAVTKQVPEYMNYLLKNYQTEVATYATEKADNLNNLLVSAAKGGNLEIIRHLLDAGADVNHGNASEVTPLVESKDGDVARFLISKGANVNHVMFDGNTPLLKILGERYKYVHSDGRYEYASSDMEIVKVLLGNGASVNGRQSRGRTPVMVAASKEGTVTMLQVLLDHGAHFNGQDDEGDTALICAVRGHCSQNVSFLLHFAKEKNLCLNVQNNKGLSALMFAATSGSPKMLKELVDYNVDVNIKDSKGNTALLNSIIEKSSSSVEILTTLIRAGSDVNCQNNDGLSPLMLAARSSHEDVILLLLSSGADVNAVSKKDATKTAISFLQTTGYLGRDKKSCLQALLGRGASSSYVNPGLLHELIMCNEFDIMFELIRCGLGPVDLTAESLPLKLGDKEISHVSPLCVALLAGNDILARCFVDNLFLTSSDVTTLTGNKNLLQVLERKNHKNCQDFLDEMSSQPLSLLQLAFVAVSSAVGSSPGRENRVILLPLPQIMKDKLLFKTKELQFNIPKDDIVTLFDKYQERNIISLFQVVDYIEYFCANISSDSDDYNYRFYGSDTD